eukprot:gene9207-biopygen337
MPTTAGSPTFACARAGKCCAASLRSWRTPLRWLGELPVRPREEGGRKVGVTRARTEPAVRGEQEGTASADRGVDDLVRDFLR